MDIVQQVLRSSEREKYIAQHGLGGFLFRNLAEAERTPYEKVYLQTWHLNELYLREYNFLREKALSEGVMCEGLKGIYLLKSVYQDDGVRKMSDIDVLTDSEAVLNRILLSSGYKKIDQTEYKTTFSKFVQGNEVAIEIHSRLYDDNRIIPILENGCLSLDEHFYYLVYHLGYQHTYLRLNWFVDLHVFMTRYKVNIDSILRMAKERNHEKAFLITFYFYNKFFGSQLPELRPLFAHLFDFDFFLDPQKKIVSYQILKHQTKQSIFEALKYDLFWLKKKF